MDKALVERSFEECQPKVVFHCVAYTAVDKDEDEGKEINWAAMSRRRRMSQM